MVGHGAWDVAPVVAFYFVTSISTVFLNKWLFSDRRIDAPLFLTWTQMVVAVLCSVLFGTLRGTCSVFAAFPRFQLDLKTALHVLPASVFFTLMLLSTNLCLKDVDVAFYQVARAWTVVCNIVLSYWLLGTRTSLKAAAACALVIAGYLYACEGEFTLRAVYGELVAQVSACLPWPWASSCRFSPSVGGLVWGFLASVTLSLYSIFTKKITSALGNDTLKLFSYTNFTAMAVLPLVILGATDELAELRSARAQELLRSWSFALMTLVTGVSGTLVNVASILQIQRTSSLTHNVSGTAKAAVQSVLGWAFAHKPTSLTTILGTAVTTFGCGLYSYIRYLGRAWLPCLLVRSFVFFFICQPDP